jgi:hypothetical protein
VTATGSMQCPCIVSHSDGGSRFVMHDLDMGALAPTAGLPLIATSSLWPSSGIQFMQIPESDSGTPLPWHPAPGPRLIICLSGTSRQETTDGDVRTFTAGEMFLTVDVTGTGHRSTNFGATRYAIVLLSRDPTA